MEMIVSGTGSIFVPLKSTQFTGFLFVKLSYIGKSQPYKVLPLLQKKSRTPKYVIEIFWQEIAKSLIKKFPTSEIDLQTIQGRLRSSCSSGNDPGNALGRRKTLWVVGKRSGSPGSAPESLRVIWHCSGDDFAAPDITCSSGNAPGTTSPLWVFGKRSWSSWNASGSLQVVGSF